MSQIEITPEQKIVNGANWFYWIAGLSAVNTVSYLTGADWSFIIGLGLTQVIDAIALGMELGTTGKIIVAVIDLMVLGVVVVFGVMARKSKWIYLVGMTLFALDSVIFIMASDWIGLGFHALVLFFMWPGFMAFAQRDAIYQASELAPAEPVPVPVETGGVLSDEENRL